MIIEPGELQFNPRERVSFYPIWPLRISTGQKLARPLLETWYANLGKAQEI